MLKRVVLFFIGCAFFVGVGCSTKSTKSESDLDRTVKHENEANTPEEIAQRAAEVFASAPGLSSEQKLKLLGIYSRTYKESMSIRSEIGKSKSLLFKLVASVKYNSKDVEQLKKKVVDLDQRRLNVMFKALEDVQGVVGYGAGKQELYEHFRHYEVPGGVLVGRE
jgi:hypothetical protein